MREKKSSTLKRPPVIDRHLKLPVRRVGVSILTCASLFLAIPIGGTGCASLPGPGNGIARHQGVKWVSGDNSVQRWTLANGLKLIVLEDHSSPTFAWQTWFGVGSRDEEDQKTGLAHLFEHMMFKGTRFRPDGEFDRLLDAAGAEGQNAFTSNDHTAYVQELPIESLELIATLESERMRGLMVDDQAFKTEREVVQNERRMRTENSPDGMMYQEMFGVAFKKQAYRWPVIGYAKDLEGMSASDARAFYDKWYQPKNATIVVVGDVNPRHIVNLVLAKYGSLGTSASQGTLPSPMRTYAIEPAQNQARRKDIALNMQVDKALVGWKVPEALHQDTAALLVLDSILTSGNSSRLNQALVDSGIASGVFGYHLMAVEPSLYLVGFTLQPGKRISLGESTLLKVVDSISKTPPTEDEMEKAKTRLEFDFFDGLNSNDEIANLLGEAETDLGAFEKTFELRTKISKVTAQEVSQAARKWLNPNSRNTVIGQPKAKGAKR